jgi:hypothetical protein
MTYIQIQTNQQISNGEVNMQANSKNSTSDNQYQITDYYPEGMTCDNCKRNVFELEPFPATKSKPVDNMRKPLEKEAFSAWDKEHNPDVHMLSTVKRTGGTYCIGSSRECKDCSWLPDQAATIQSSDAYIREQVKHICAEAGVDFLSRLIQDRENSENDDQSTTYIERVIADNMITIQNNNNKTVFVINDPPHDGRCMICGRKVDELEPFDQEFIDKLKKEEKKIGGDVEVTHCISPYLAENNKLAKNFRYFEGDGLKTVWACTNCFAFTDKGYIEWVLCEDDL